jgi:hypothetical protein
VLIFAFTFNIYGDTLSEVSFANPIVDAANKGDVAEVIHLAKNGHSLNSKGLFGATALMRAAYNGHVLLVKELLARGVEVNAKDFGGASALHFAARAGRLAIVELLLENNSLRVDETDNDGWTPLMRATNNQNISVVTLLLSKGANPLLTNKWHNDAITDAVMTTNVDLVKTFIAHDLFKIISDNERTRLIHLAKAKRSIEVADLLEENYDIAPSPFEAIKTDKVKSNSLSKEDVIELPKDQEVILGSTSKELHKELELSQNVAKQEPLKKTPTEEVVSLSKAKKAKPVVGPKVVASTKAIEPVAIAEVAASDVAAAKASEQQTLVAVQDEAALPWYQDVKDEEVSGEVKQTPILGVAKQTPIAKPAVGPKVVASSMVSAKAVEPEKVVTSTKVVKDAGEVKQTPIAKPAVGPKVVASSMVSAKAVEPEKVVTSTKVVKDAGEVKQTPIAKPAVGPKVVASVKVATKAVEPAKPAAEVAKSAEASASGGSGNVTIASASAASYNASSGNVTTTKASEEQTLVAVEEEAILPWHKDFKEAEVANNIKETKDSEDLKQTPILGVAKQTPIAKPAVGPKVIAKAAKDSGEIKQTPIAKPAAGETVVASVKASPKAVDPVKPAAEAGNVTAAKAIASTNSGSGNVTTTKASEEQTLVAVEDEAILPWHKDFKEIKDAGDLKQTPIVGVEKNTQISKPVAEAKVIASTKLVKDSGEVKQTPIAKPAVGPKVVASVKAATKAVEPAPITKAVEPAKPAAEVAKSAEANNLSTASGSATASSGNVTTTKASEEQTLVAVGEEAILPWHKDFKEAEVANNTKETKDSGDLKQAPILGVAKQTPIAKPAVGPKVVASSKVAAKDVGPEKVVASTKIVKDAGEVKQTLIAKPAVEPKVVASTKLSTKDVEPEKVVASTKAAMKPAGPKTIATLKATPKPIEPAKPVAEVAKSAETAPTTTVAKHEAEVALPKHQEVKDSVNLIKPHHFSNTPTSYNIPNNIWLQAQIEDGEQVMQQLSENNEFDGMRIQLIKNYVSDNNLTTIKIGPFNEKDDLRQKCAIITSGRFGCSIEKN